MGLLRRKRLIFGVIAVFALFGFVLWLHSSAAKARFARYAESYLQDKLRVTAQIGSLDYSLFPIHVELKDVRLYEDARRKNVFLKASRVGMDVEASSLWERKLHLKSLRADLESLDPAHPPRIDLRDLRKLEFRIDQMSAQVRPFQFAKLTLSDFELQSAASKDHLDIKVVRFRAGDLRFSASGRVTYGDGKGHLDYRLRGDASAFSPMLPGAFPIRGALAADGAMTLDGGQTIITGSAEAPALSLSGAAPFPVKAKYRFSPEQGFQVSAASSAKKLEAEVQGKLSGGVVEINRGHLAFAAGGRPFEANIASARYDLIHSNGMVQATTSLGPLSARLDRGRYALDLRIQHYHTAWTLAVLRKQLRVAAEVTGALTASGTLKNIRQSNAALFIEHAELARNKQKITVESSRLKLAGPRVDLDLHGALPEGKYIASGFVPLEPAGPLSFHVSATTDVKILTLLDSQISGQGAVAAEINVGGTRSHPSPEGKVRADHFELTLHQIDFRDARALASFNADRVVLEGSARWQDSPVIVDCVLPLSDAPGSVHLAAASLPLSASGLPVKGQAGLDVRATGRGKNLANWNGHVILSASNVQWNNLPIEAPTVQMNLSRGVLQVPDTSIRLGDFVDLHTAGQVDLARGTIDVQGQGYGNLKVIPYFSPDIQSAGEFSTHLHVGGTFSSPDLTGGMQVADASFRTSAAPFALEKLNGSALLKGKEVILERVSAKLAEGTIEAGGTIQLNHGKPSPNHLWMRARQIGINYPQDIRAEIDADLNLEQRNNQPVLSGNILLAHTILARPVDDKVRTFVSLALEKLALAPEKSLLPVSLDLRIQNADPVLVSNNLGRLAATVDLKVTGDTTLPRMDGLVHVREGSELFLQTRTFVVQRGDVYLEDVPAAPPRLDLLLTSRIPDDETKQVYQIRLPIAGPMDNLYDLPPQSSPSLPPQQIYFLLLTGRSDAQLTPAKSRFLRNQLVAYYSALIVLPAPDIVPQKQDLNAVAIHPELISSERNPSDRFLDGKDLASGVSMLYSLPLSGSTEPMWIANYAIRRNLLFRFIDQEDGSYSSNLQHSLRFGRKNALVASAPEPALKIYGSFWTTKRICLTRRFKTRFRSEKEIVTKRGKFRKSCFVSKKNCRKTVFWLPLLV